uniref:VWFA domain-containing protein n=1 Tax=Acanthochromis polyacanthus TaxID=80966 RepID=A0A3Q1GCS6_9TELE
VAIVQYSDTAEINFNLRRYSTENDVLEAIRGLNHKGGYPLNIGAALKYVSQHAFTVESGSRLLEGVPQILILLSGGRSGDDIRTPVKNLREIGVISVAIGTTDADTLELQTVSQEPSYALSITDYEELPSVKQDVFSSMNRDIVFLIDGSDDVRSRFSAVREFVAKVAGRFDLDQRKDKVAVVQYSNNPELSFSLDTYITKDDVLKHIASLKPKGGRPQYIGAALQFVKDNVFVEKAGGRRNEDTKQILIVLAGGRSRDSPRGPGNALKAAGVVAIAIGSRMSNSAELELISSNPEYTYSVADFVNLPRIEQSLMSHLTEMAVEVESSGGKKINCTFY